MVVTGTNLGARFRCQISNAKVSLRLSPLSRGAIVSHARRSVGGPDSSVNGEIDGDTVNRHSHSTAYDYFLSDCFYVGGVVGFSRCNGAALVKDAPRRCALPDDTASSRATWPVFHKVCTVSNR